MVMSFISWWYRGGWAAKSEQILDSLERSIDYFSLSILIRTWFSPFRQIDAAKYSNLPLNLRMRNFFDRSFSRVFGAIIRTIVMLIGIMFIAIKALLGLFLLAIWPFFPILPIVFAVLFLLGVSV